MGEGAYSSLVFVALRDHLTDQTDLTNGVHAWDRF